MPDKMPREGYIVNPKTGRYIKIDGPTAKKLFKSGEIPRPAKDCPPGKVHNPKTGRCIDINGSLAKKLGLNKKPEAGAGAAPPPQAEPKQLKVQLTMEKQIKKLNDTLANFFEINSLYSYDELSKAINTNKELKKIYNNLDADFILYSSFNFTNVNEIQSVIDDYNIKLDKYKKILKEYYY